jgi:RNA polymerase sigma factor (sigma-70 family)
MAAYVGGKLKGLGAQAQRDGYDDVLQELLVKVLDLGSDRGDFYQVRFWLALEGSTLRVFARLVRAAQQERYRVDYAALPGYTDDAAEDQQRVRVAELDEIADTSAEDRVIARDQLMDALEHIPERYRDAFLLRHYAGWPIEDQDPSVRTISRHFGVDPRTIRNWFGRIDEALAQWRGEQRDD